MQPDFGELRLPRPLMPGVKAGGKNTSNSQSYVTWRIRDSKMR
jgi:hypothetical protein